MVRETRRRMITAAGLIGALSLSGCVSAVRDHDDQTEPSDDNDLADEDPPTGDQDQVEDDTDDTHENDVEAEDSDDAEEEEPDELDHLPGEVIDDFEDLDEWYATIGQGAIEGVEDDVYAGLQSAQITAGEELEYASVYREFLDPLDIHGKNLSLAIKFDGRDLLDVTVQILAPNSRNYLNHRRVLTGPRDRWTRIDLGANYQQTQPDLFDVREIRVFVRRRGDDSGQIACTIDDLRATERPDTGAVMLLFDGTLEDHYEVALDIMNEFGFAGVEAVTPEYVPEDGRLSLEQMREMQDAGWEMISRPRVGGRFMHEYTEDEQEGMIRRTKTFLLNRGFTEGAEHFFTPRNIISPVGMDLVREYHEQAFRFGGAPNALPVTDPHNLGHFSASDESATRTFIDLAAEHKHLAVPRFEYMGEDGLSEDAFRDLLEHIEAADVRVLTASELLSE